jgi:hypothetical protein
MSLSDPRIELVKDVGGGGDSHEHSNTEDSRDG